MNSLRFILILLFLYACSPKISEHFDSNVYIRNYNIHIVNDTLQLYFKSPADIAYTTDKKQLKKRIRKGKFKLYDSVLVYGVTNDPPYEYFVTLSKNIKQAYPDHFVVFDTLINGNTIRFIGNPLAENAQQSLENDLSAMFNSLEVGEMYRKDVSSVMDILRRHENSNKFFAILNEISEFPTYDHPEEWTKLQLELTYASFLGHNKLYDHYLDQLESRFTPNDSIAEIVRENSIIGLNVLDTIITQAENHKIVMINENHFYPNHRLLISDLLVKLKDKGYSYLALEALDVDQDSLLNLENAYPTLKTGFYTSEQNYSNIIREAKRLGYTFVAYENTEEDKERELAQAENLYNNTFKLDPKAKVLVLAGIDHILENPTSDGKAWMATVFKEKYNIDPLTISQTHLNAYRKEINTNYALINSMFFNDDKLKSVDYLVLNNKNEHLADSLLTVSYENKTSTDVQVALFYGKEITGAYDHHNKVPYFTTILKSKATYALPLIENEDLYLYVYDSSGAKIDSQFIKAVRQEEK